MTNKNHAKSFGPYFDDIYQRNKRELYGYALYLCGDRQNAEDLCHDSFMRLYNFLRSKNTRIENPKAWLFKTLRNLAYNAHHKNQIAKAAHLNLLNIKEQTDNEPQEKNADGFETLKKTLGLLSTEQTEAIVMHYIHGLTYEEIAAALDSTKTTIASRIQRGIQALKEKMPELAQE